MADDFVEAFAEWLTETVQVRTYLGPGPKGSVLGASANVEGVMVKDGNRLIRGSDAEERVSDATLVMPLTLAHHFALESEVTLPDGRVRQVHQRSVDKADRPLAHCRVVLS